MALAALDEHAAGLSWTVAEPLARGSSALVHDGGVWLVDPVDEPEALARVAELGEPAAVLQLLDRHPRDCAALAARLGVPHVRLPGALPGTPFVPVRVVATRVWREVALWWPARRALVVAEALGTNVFYRSGGRPLGVHPFLRPFPPRVLAGHGPEHLLAGHGAPLHGAEVAEQVEAAIAASRRDIPGVLLGLPLAARAARSR